MAAHRYRIRVWIFLASIVIPAAIYGLLGVELYLQSHTPRLRFAFYAAGIVLALAVTLFCRYVVWQDYQREARAAELRSAFVARVSHELRTPLTSIRMLAETLSLGRVAEADRQREYLDTIVRETERLSGMVENVLEFSRAEAAPRLLENVEVRPIVDQALAPLRPSLEQRGFSLAVDGATSATVRADGEALRQAIANLVTNAIKYSGESTRIEVRIIRAGADARIEVADWGIGVPAQFRTRIFERFFRVPRTDDAAGGVGLGLSLVAEIMRAHGGRAEVHDNTPRGSVFSLILPMAKS
ncbi:MAG TPA: HAMP domain-containing sensor histidine kinase [Bryobacteraceae bacterium]|nr:HAMP domain-containing sensor histidine kinase [Bryobacteraceae bacterium]